MEIKDVDNTRLKEGRKEDRNGGQKGEKKGHNEPHKYKSSLDEQNR